MVVLTFVDPGSFLGVWALGVDVQDPMVAETLEGRGTWKAGKSWIRSPSIRLIPSLTLLTCDIQNPGPSDSEVYLWNRGSLAHLFARFPSIPARSLTSVRVLALLVKGLISPK